MGFLNAVASIGSGLFANKAAKDAREWQADHNMKLAKFQAQANEKYLDKQLAYDSPKNQMLRFQEAGLNPHLIYGQGSPGNQGSPLSHPDVKPADGQQIPSFVADIMKTIPQLLSNLSLQRSQIAATDAKTDKTILEQGVVKLQQDVMSKNPVLNEQGFNAIIDSLISTANQKAADVNTSIIRYQNEAENLKQNQIKTAWAEKHGYDKMNAELNSLWQKMGLNEADLKIRNEILTSKKFANAIQELELKFIKDFELNGNQIMTFVRLLLMKL